MQTLIPHLWYDKEALEAARFYTSVFPESQLDWTYHLSDTPSGDAQLVQFRLVNMTLAAISAGPYFHLNESMSLMVQVSKKEEVDRLYQSLSQNGKVLMPLGEYPFNAYYVWFEDQYGLSWQLLYNPEQTVSHHLEICLLFSKDQVGSAEDFLQKYVSLLPGAELGQRSYYAQGEASLPQAKLNYGELVLPNQKLIVMDHGYGGENGFNEAFSLMIYVNSPEEMAAYYDAFSSVKEAEQCGWVKDEFGISWQIVPQKLMEAYGNPAQADRLKAVNAAILEMKRLDYQRIVDLL